MTAGRLTAVFSSDGLGGSELFNLEFLRTARQCGIEVNAVVPGDGPLCEVLAPLVQTIQRVPIPDRLTSMSRFEAGLNVTALPGRVSALGSYLPRLARSLTRTPGPVCSLGFRAQLAAGAVLAPGRPIIWIVHEVVPAGAPATIWRIASRRATQIVTYSHAAARQPALRGRGAIVRAVRFDLSRFAAVEASASVGTIGLVGDLVELKNHLLALEVAQRVRSAGHDVSVLLVGRDVGRAVPRARAYAERVREAVATMPRAELIASTPEDMPATMARLDLLLHLSSVPESFGRVCIEAMAAGRPVVAFDHGAVSELVEHARTGFLCPPGGVDAAVDAVLGLARDPARHAEMSEAARVSAVERFSENSAQRDTVGHALADFALTRS